MYGIQDVTREDTLLYPKRVPQNSPQVSETRPMLAQIKKQDILLHYPYQSIRPFLRLLQEAAEDETVLSIKITLYRVARNSQVIDALCRAAENGIRYWCWWSCVPGSMRKTTSAGPGGYSVQAAR